MVSVDSVHTWTVIEISSYTYYVRMSVVNWEKIPEIPRSGD